MIVLDANVLLYAYDEQADCYQQARQWVTSAFSGELLIGLPWQTIGAFLRIATNPRLPGSRFTTEEAIEIVTSWLEQPNVRLLSPGERHWPLLQRLLLKGQVRGPGITDAQLAAITLEHGGILNTTDHGFARFSGLRWTNPLIT